MKRIHIAVAVANFADSVAEYTKRFGQHPCCTVAGEYALWRTEILNFSMKVDANNAGEIRHLGFENDAAKVFGETTDVNGIVWESFSYEQQRQEILQRWPDAQFHTE